MPSPTDDETPFPALHHDATLHRSHLSPSDACLSPTLRRSLDGDGTSDSTTRMRRLHSGGGGGERNGSRRRKRTWKKLMWVKQSYPDNYTDQATFLENLQRNPRLKPYDFWPLVADSTVVLQHVCSVIIFVVCFVNIFLSRVSPVSVVSWSSAGTCVGWYLWERWVAEEEDLENEMVMMMMATNTHVPNAGVASGARSDTPGADSTSGTDAGTGAGPGPGPGITTRPRRRTRAGSMRRPLLPIPPPSRSIAAVMSAANPATNVDLHVAAAAAAAAAATTTNLGRTRSSDESQPTSPCPSAVLRADLSSGDSSTPSAAACAAEETMAGEESRLVQRLGTVKSAMLIYSTLLGLSPILKSLTRSTSSDSIWAVSFWLLVLNVLFFDYSGGVGAKFPASLSTNAALMASTVLASRLPDTTQVFSLTLFSIQVFGLFPVFRRHVRHRSWRYHVVLTGLLVLGAGLGTGMVLGGGGGGEAGGPGEGGGGGWPWRRGVVGMVVGVVMAGVAAGGCSWWLIGLQKYKNEIRGPWDPARPIIMNRPRWD